MELIFKNRSQIAYVERIVFLIFRVHVLRIK